MELKPGYKQTEVGVIPEDWDVKRLGEVARFRTGPFGSALHKEDYTNNGIPIVNPMHIVDAAIVPTQEMTITAQRASELADFRLRQGDIVVGRRGEMGRCAVVEAAQDGWLCGTGSMIVRANPGYSAEFLQLVLSSKPVIASIENASVGSTMINLNQGVLNGLKLALPSNKEEQQAIATSIKAFGSQVEALQSLITKKRQIKQAAMQELLTGKLRLPGFEGEWEVRELSSLGTWRGGMTPSMRNGDYWNQGDLPWIVSGDVKVSRLSDTSQHVTADAVSSGAAVVVPANSIVLVTRSGILRKQLPVSLLERPMAINQDIKALIPARDIDSSYLLHALTWAGSQILKSCMKTGTTVESIELAWLKRFTIPVPSHEEQVAIAKALSEMESELAEMEAQRAKAIALKRGIMQQLLTGKIRLI